MGGPEGEQEITTMTTSRVPGFSAEASFYRSGAHYRTGPTSAGLRKGGNGTLHPALARAPEFTCDDIYTGPFSFFNRMCSLCGGDPDEGTEWCLHFEVIPGLP
jgi:hypothetical protein